MSFMLLKLVDLVIEVCWVVLVEFYVVVLEQYVVVVDVDCIVVLLLIVEVCVVYVLCEWVELGEYVLIFGLINSYMYNLMILLCGLVDDLLLMIWLQEYIWLVEVKVIGLEFVCDGVELVVVEMLCGGIICVNENYFFFDVIGVIYCKLGFCVVVGLLVIEFLIVWVKIQDEYFECVGEVYDSFFGDLLVGIVFVLYVLYIVFDVSFECICVLVDQFDILVYLYLYEIVYEVEEEKKKSGLCLFQWLQKLDLVNDCLIVVYMIQVIDVEIVVCVEVGVLVVYCFELNFKLVLGFCLVEKFCWVGVNLVVVIDGCVFNNDLDMFGEMCIVVILVKVVVQDVVVFDVVFVLCVGMFNVVCVMGLEDKVGLIEVGKQVDFVVVCLSDLEIQLLFYVVLQLVYVIGCYQVIDVWIVGCCKLVGCQLVDMDVEVIFVCMWQWCEWIVVV